eukprot:TRINITY_DN8577_c0_g1_i12.p2 TRINITY_DN8577_c0_g1~~TRINITY_DN8577_c0_g1_i12.p2  ORF type:complete len:268 (+),score=36.59 TRINITY_DN8577_c0_g1_i12:417-1220(+)
MRYCEKFGLSIMGNKEALARRIAQKWVNEKTSQKITDGNESSVSNKKNTFARPAARKFVQIQDKNFYTFDTLVSHFHRLLWDGHIGKIFEGDELGDITQVLKNHKFAEDKIGDGIDYITIGIDDEYRSRCFQVRRLDGSFESFSYRKVLRYLWTGEWSTQPVLRQNQNHIDDWWEDDKNRDDQFNSAQKQTKIELTSQLLQDIMLSPQEIENNKDQSIQEDQKDIIASLSNIPTDVSFENSQQEAVPDNQDEVLSALLQDDLYQQLQ